MIAIVALVLVLIGIPLTEPWDTTNPFWFFGSAALEGVALTTLVVLLADRLAS